MFHAPATDDDLVVRYERMLERYLDVPLAVAGVGFDEPLTVEHRRLIEVVHRARAPVAVADVSRDERFADVPKVGDIEIAAFVGWPVLDAEGRAVAALCAVDDQPRAWTRDDLDTLTDLADAFSGELAHRRARAEAERQADRARELNRRSRVLLALSEGLSGTRTLDDIAYAVERVATEQLECLHAGIWLLRRARDAAETDRMRYISDPAASWNSAALNSSLPVDESNPLGAALVTGRTLLYANSAEQNAVYPHLNYSRQVGETRFFMPLGLGRTFGVLVLVWEAEVTLSAEDRVTISTLASYVSQAVQRAELLEERERASSTLQTAMLPRLPEVAHMELTARYRPAAIHDRVGGDWYDAVVTHSGATDLMIGDVSGHDIAAAAVMGEVRSMLRAFSFGHDDDPATNVTRLDQALERFGIDRFASLLYIRAEQPDNSGYRTLRWTNAGHFPPLLLRPDGTVALLHDQVHNDLVLGVDASTERRDYQCAVPSGSILVLFTDGLVERRGEGLTEGLARLQAAAARLHGRAPGAILDALIDSLVGVDNEDDVAVLAARLA